jgi:hypothetical protein
VVGFGNLNCRLFTALKAAVEAYLENFSKLERIRPAVCPIKIASRHGPLSC